MKEKPKKTKIEVFLDDASIELLEKLADQQGTSRSGVARALILKGLEPIKAEKP